MRIPLITTYRNSVDAINEAGAQMTDAQRQVATGRRIGVPSDDPAGNAVAMAQNAAIAQIDAYTQASDAVSSHLSIADSALTDMVNQLSAARTAALSARGSNISQSQRTAAVASLQSIRDALVNDLNTQVGSVYIFAGTKTTTQPFTEAGGVVSSYLGNSTTDAIDIGTSRSVALTLDGSQITQGSDPQDVFAAISNLITAIQAGDDNGIGQGETDLANAFDRATSAQTLVGIALSSITGAQQQLTATRLQATTRLSQVQDANMAQAIADMTKTSTAYQAALGAFAKIGQLSLMDYLK
jgi:flagellar hook-associated protein 3 FlgL